MSADGAEPADGVEPAGGAEQFDRVGKSAAPWRSAAAQVLVDDLDAPALDDDQAHHVRRVLRLRPGTQVCAADGAGGWRRCELGADGGLEPIEALGRIDRPNPTIAVAVALVKGDRPELIVQKLTELGVDRIVAFVARRSVVRPDPARRVRQLERLRRVAIEACAQSRRLWLPEVDLLADVDSVVASAGAGVVAADPGGRPPRGSDRCVLVGPEGGWEPGEVDGIERIGLADHVLRAETAAITAGALLAALRSARVAPAGAPAP